MERTVRIKPDGTVVCLHADGVNYEALGDVAIERASDVSYAPGKGWIAKFIHPAFKTKCCTTPRKNRKDAIADEEIILNGVLQHGQAKF